MTATASPIGLGSTEPEPADSDQPQRHEQANPSVPVLDLVVPVYNEAPVLEQSVRRLRRYLDHDFPLPARITIVDNASTDATFAVAQRLAATVAGVRVMHLAQKGRGRALRAAWADTDAQVVAYTDVDLSTDLAALAPMVTAIVSGHSDLAIGSRLHSSARVTRGPKREFISRSYNLILRTTLAARFRDAQCGFKAVRSDIAKTLLPLIEDEGWFFDTELLVLAERSGLRSSRFPSTGWTTPTVGSTSSPPRSPTSGEWPVSAAGSSTARCVADWPTRSAVVSAVSAINSGDSR